MCPVFRFSPGAVLPGKINAGLVVTSSLNPGGTCSGERRTTICGAGASSSCSHPCSLSSAHWWTIPWVLGSCASMWLHSPGGGARSVSSATMRSSSDGMQSSIWLLAHEAHRSGATHSGAGMPSIVCSALLASSTASARPKSESPRGESEPISSGIASTDESGKMSRPTASSSCASVSAASTVALSPIRLKRSASNGRCDASTSAWCTSLIASSARICTHSFTMLCGSFAEASRGKTSCCSSFCRTTSPWHIRNTLRCC
mmetsp:Transcript_31016/g.65362  ORF Transcript_31016/g.65362 Transcript_31016/m.65362 type:complete len:259 (+) Transcript_31016:805-1581(+)